MPDEPLIEVGRPGRKRMLICANCGAEFIPSRSDAKWCSRRCQSHAWATGQNSPRKTSSSLEPYVPPASHPISSMQTDILTQLAARLYDIRFPGCEVKGLLLDRQTGLVTALMRLSPDFFLTTSMSRSNRLTCSKANWSIRKGRRRA
jgi:hypothetical protein